MFQSQSDFNPILAAKEGMEWLTTQIQRKAPALTAMPAEMDELPPGVQAAILTILSQGVSYSEMWEALAFYENVTGSKKLDG